MPPIVNNDILHAHENVGEMGIDKPENKININKLLILMQALTEKGKLKNIMLGAIEILQDYCGISTPPLETTCVKYTISPHDMWIYNLKNG